MWKKENYTSNKVLFFVIIITNDYGLPREMVCKTVFYHQDKANQITGIGKMAKDLKTLMQN